MKEIWKDVKGYEGLYSVSNTGLVKSIRNNKIIASRKTKDGYIRVNIYRNGNSKTCKIHRLVAQAFIPNEMNKPTVNHKNGIKEDNKLSNLEWMTFKENYSHYLNSRGD